MYSLNYIEEPERRIVKIFKSALRLAIGLILLIGAYVLVLGFLAYNSVY